MDFEFDRSFSTNQTSSVIDTVYYNSEDQKLVVKLVTEDWYGHQVLAGYQDVPADVFTAMELTNQLRVNGDNHSSVGRYWNTWVKPNFTGFDTSHIEDFVDVGSPIVENEKPVTLSDQPLPPVQSDAYVIEFVMSNADDLVGSLFVIATDESDALSRFNDIAEIAQWPEFVVLAITHVL